MRVGLYGGSFNPPHAGHRHVSLMALRRLDLDRLWWIVTPGNPLKSRGRLAAIEERMRRRSRSPPSAHRRHLLRGGDRRPLYGRHARLLKRR